MKPLVIVNFKAYKEAYGTQAIGLTKACEMVAKEAKATIVAVPALPDLAFVAGKVQLQIFSQHVDIVEEGAFTGHITAAHLAALGVNGSLINHSERPVPISHIKKAVALCRKYHLTSVVCAADKAKINAILNVCSPDYIAYEPPDLIGGNISVTSAKPGIVKEAAALIKKKDRSVGFLCGAGVKTREDLMLATRLGAAGVLLASGIVKAKDPEKALRDLTAPSHKSS